MGMLKEFEHSLATKFTNALHATFHQDLYTIIDEKIADLTVFHISEDLKEEYHEMVEELMDRNCVAIASVDTKTANKYNVERSRLATLLFFTTDSCTQSLDEEKRAAAEELEVLFRQYKRLQNKSDNEKTGLIRGLISDSYTDKYNTAVTTLGLRPMLDLLEANNNTFAELKTKRINERSEAMHKLTVKELRQQTDDKLKEIQDLMRMSELLYSLDSETSGKQTNVNNIMKLMNTVIVDYRTTYNRSKAQKDAAKKKKDEVLPSEDEEKPNENLEDPTEDDTQFEPIPVPNEDKKA